MALEVRLVQKLSQNLLMTPQLQQAIKLLQLGRTELVEAIERELLENPVLEEMREPAGNDRESPQETEVFQANVELPAEEPALNGDSQTPVDWESYLERFTDSSGTAQPRGTFDFEERPSVESAASRAESLLDHLRDQLRFMDVPAKQEPVIANILGNLDSNGYLCATYEEVASDCGVSVDDVQDAIRIVRDLDPPGLGARDLKECLLFQLEVEGHGESVAARIIRDHLDLLEKHKFDQLARSLSVSIDDIKQAIFIIQQLDPRPGVKFSDDETRYITPDIFVYRVGDDYVVSLNDDGMPKLRVSPYYLKLLKETEDQGSTNKQYLHDRLKAASWLIKSIHQRQTTIFRVTESIVKFQRDFLDLGVSALKPLTLRQVADDIGMHESTVSRVTSNKYVHTPQGVFELKYFFTSGIRTSEGEVSSEYIKERIKSLITAENPEQPISDQQLVEILNKQNLPIARRTVAKYRESLGIPSSAQRKRLFK